MNTLKTVLAAIVLTTSVLFVVGCKKTDDINNGGGNNGNSDSDVRVYTYMPQDITATTVKCGGDVIATQGLKLTELGVCWSTETSPTAADAHRSTVFWDEPLSVRLRDWSPKRNTICAHTPCVAWSIIMAKKRASPP